MPTVGRRHRSPFSPDTGYSWFLPKSIPLSSSTRPAPIGSGSSVTSGRCCAAAVVERAMRTDASQNERNTSTLEFLSAVEQQRDGSLVDERDLHGRLEFSGLDRYARAAQQIGDLVDE